MFSCSLLQPFKTHTTRFSVFVGGALETSKDITSACSICKYSCPILIKQKAACKKCTWAQEAC